MKNQKITELYDGRTPEEWHEELEPQEGWMVRHFFCAIALLGFPKTFLDIGCGFGRLVDVADALMIQAHGVDQLVAVEWASDYFTQWNLVEYFKFKHQANWVWCTEVAEHLDPSAHATLCDTLADNLMEGRENYLIFSAAHPSQGGSGHLSERPAKYWKDQFSMRELGYRHDLTVNLALLWSNIGSPLYWLPANVMVFEK